MSNSNFDVDDTHSDNEPLSSNNNKKKLHSTTGDKKDHTHHSINPSLHGQQQQVPKEKKIILNDKTFNECVSIMKPVKKALKRIDIKEACITEKEHLAKIKRYLLEIGDTINDHLTTYSDPEKIKEWRTFLWIFVSKFTSWDSERLKNLFKKFDSSRDEEQHQFNQQPSGTSNRSQNNSSLMGHRPGPSLSPGHQKYSNYSSSSDKKSWRGGGGDSSYSSTIKREADDWGVHSNNNYKHSNRPSSNSFTPNSNYHRADYESSGHNHHPYHNSAHPRYNHNVFSPNSNFSSNSHHNSTSSLNHSFGGEHLSGDAHYYSPNEFSRSNKSGSSDHYK